MIIIDPHRDDFVFEPILYRLLKRKPLKKYEYLKDLNFKYFITYNSLSVPNQIDKFIPAFLRKQLVKIEHYFWKKINNVKWERVDSLQGDSIFIFPHKKVNSFQKIFNDLSVHKFDYCFVHLSHYHLYHKEINEICGKYDKINLCSDVNLSYSDYFREKLFNYKKNLFLIPFQVRNSFFEHTVDNPIRQIYSIGVIGSYHEFPKESNFSDIKTFDGLKKTLHPIRYQLSKENLQSLRFVCYKQSLFNKKSFFSKFSTFNNQKKYFSFDIIEFYSKCNYIICASEGSGLVGIGIIEAMSLGRGVIISRQDYQTLNLTHTEGVIVYEDYDELVKIIRTKKELYKNLFFRENYEFALGFRRDNLTRKVKKILDA